MAGKAPNSKLHLFLSFKITRILYESGIDLAEDGQVNRT